MVTRRRKRWIVGGIIAVAVLALVGWTAYERLLHRDVPQYADLTEHFKYGSIGNEAELGLPYPIWSVLPEVCGHHLPTAGGYAAFGFQYEDGRDVPVGMSKVRIGFERIAINCAVCHVTPVRFSPGEAPTLLLAGTSPTFDIQAYQRFLAACAADPAFSPDTLLPAIEQRFDLDAIDGLLYRYLIIPMTRDGIQQQAEEFAWTHDNPRWGPGRIDPFNPVKFGMLGLPVDGTIGNSDMQDIWNLDARERLRANAPWHWDGLNTSLREVIITSALGDGAVPDDFDWESMDKVEAFLKAQPPPAFPGDIATPARQRGAAVFAEHCAVCHGEDGERILTIIPADEIGTDGHRLAMWGEDALAAYTAFDEGYDWNFQAFQNVEGYVARPLWGVWARAPYLHNGSVPTLADLLSPPEQRPEAFVRGLDLYDAARGGFSAPECDPADHQGPGFCYDTAQPGNANSGHTYGTTLSAADKQALLAYLLSL